MAKKIKSIEETLANSEYTEEEVPIFSEGKLITYTLSEQDIEYYVLDPEVGISGNPDAGYTIKNNHTPETVGLTVTKKWDDKDNQDGKRTDSVDVQLYKDGVIFSGKFVEETYSTCI